MKVEKNHVVAVQYTLNAIDENGEKTFIEKTEAENPFLFLYGVGMMLPKFEAELLGMAKADKKSFTITPEEGYGIRNEEAKTQLPISMFAEAGTPPLGALIPLQDQDGNHLTAVVLEVLEEGVNVDLNHPMAGQTLLFDIELEFTRPATEEELSHGHPHGISGDETH